MGAQQLGMDGQCRACSDREKSSGSKLDQGRNAQICLAASQGNGQSVNPSPRSTEPFNDKSSWQHL